MSNLEGKSGRRYRWVERYRPGYREALRQEGAYVFIMGRRQSELDKAKAEIGKNVCAVRGDVANLRIWTSSTRR